MSGTVHGLSVGRRVIVTGLAGAGKSTFSRALAAKTRLPLVHLDLHAWKPGWVRMSDDELLDAHRSALAGEEWIADGNYHQTLAPRLERADAVVFLDTPWWVCSARAFMRGIRRRPPGAQMPDGCEDDPWQRLRDEWAIVGRVWRVRHAERERELRIIRDHGAHVALHVLRTKDDVRTFLERIDGGAGGP